MPNWCMCQKRQYRQSRANFLENPKSVRGDRMDEYQAKHHHLHHYDKSLFQNFQTQRCFEHLWQNERRMRQNVTKHNYLQLHHWLQCQMWQHGQSHWNFRPYVSRRWLKYGQTRFNYILNTHQRSLPSKKHRACFNIAWENASPGHQSWWGFVQLITWRVSQSRWNWPGTQVFQKHEEAKDKSK